MCQNLSAVKASGQGGILDFLNKIIFNITIFILPKKKQKGGGVIYAFIHVFKNKKRATSLLSMAKKLTFSCPKSRSTYRNFYEKKDVFI